MKKIIAFIFAVIMVLNLFAVAATGEIWSGKISESLKGKGTESEPYLIETAEDLALLSEKVYKGKNFEGEYFLMTKDIALNDTTKYRNWDYDPPENEWNPIGMPRAYFKGIFDGGGNRVSGVYISDEAKNYAGLFGYVKDAVIKNIGVEKSYVYGRDDVGMLIGMAENSKVSFVETEGYIEGNDNVGGIIGSLNNSTIENAKSETEVMAGEIGGGIAGNAYMAKIISCASDEAVTGVLASGGIVGILRESEAKNCYSRGEISAETYAGGIAGYVYEFSSVKYAYSVGNVISEKASGGIAGANYGSIDSVYTKGFTSGEYNGGIVGINSPLSEDSDLPEYGEIENACFAEDRSEKGVGYTVAEEDEIDITALKASKINDSFIKSYILNGKYISEEDRAEFPDNVWVFKDKNPGLFFEYSKLTEKPEGDGPGNENLPEDSDKPEEDNYPLPEKPEIGIKTGEVVSTDIRAYINGNELKAYNIGGKMAVALKDLREFGFDVIFDEDKKTVNVSYKGGEINSSYVYEESELEIGSYLMDVLSTDIEAYLEGEKTESFNAEGYTHVYFRDLSLFGEVSFDEDKREAHLELK